MVNLRLVLIITVTVSMNFNCSMISENLAVICEEDLPQYAGLCYQAAANCQVSLGNTLEQAYLLIKAFRQYMSNYLRYVTQRLVYTDENYHEALVCYKECIDWYVQVYFLHQHLF